MRCPLCKPGHRLFGQRILRHASSVSRLLLRQHLQESPLHHTPQTAHQMLRPPACASLERRAFPYPGQVHVENNIFGWEVEIFSQINKKSLEFAFCEAKIKEKLIQQL